MNNHDLIRTIPYGSKQLWYTADPTTIQSH